MPVTHAGCHDRHCTAAIAIGSGQTVSAPDIASFQPELRQQLNGPHSSAHSCLSIEAGSLLNRILDRDIPRSAAALHISPTRHGGYSILNDRGLCLWLLSPKLIYFLRRSELH